eukprot:4448079-Prorocentrum_lima.AAC.1
MDSSHPHACAHRSRGTDSSATTRSMAAPTPRCASHALLHGCKDATAAAPLPQKIPFQQRSSSARSSLRSVFKL